MIVGVPKEVKDSENRVSTTPAGVAEYVSHGHRVIVERGAGAGERASPTANTRRRVPNWWPTTLRSLPARR